jgi:hypothetical protein
MVKVTSNKKPHLPLPTGRIGASENIGEAYVFYLTTVVKITQMFLYQIAK